MKKIYYGLILMILLLGIILIRDNTIIFKNTEISLGDVVQGDIDGDGKVKSTDLILIKKHLLEEKLLTGDEKSRAENLDGKSGIKSGDLMVLKKILLGEISTSKKSNPITVTEDQSWNVNYSTSAETKSFKEATKAQGKVTYKVHKQKNSSGTKVSYFSIPTNTEAKIKMKAKTPAGTYTVSIYATAAGNDNYNSGTREIIMTVKVKESKVKDSLEIHFFASGFYDDAILIRTNDKTIFMDGGRGDTQVVNYLNALKIKTIDYVIGSHTEYDHIHAQGEVIKNFNVKNVIYPNDIYNCGCNCEGKDVSAVRDALNSKNMRAQVQSVPSKLEIGSMTLYFIAPFKLVCNKNNNSFVFILKFGNNKFMFTGDADSVLHDVDGLNSNAKALGLSDISVDVLKWPHHGQQGFDNKFMDAVGGKIYAVPNYGANGYPSEYYRNLLSTERGIKIYRQSDSTTGNFVITSDGTNIKVTMNTNAKDYVR